VERRSTRTFERSVSKPKRWLRSPNTGERRITPLKPTPAYQARKAALTDTWVRQSLDLVEEGIVVDPDHRVRRQQIGDLVLDMTEPGILVMYSIVDDEAILVTFRILFES
jgi:hypothetical protein